MSVQDLQRISLIRGEFDQSEKKISESINGFVKHTVYNAFQIFLGTLKVFILCMFVYRHMCVQVHMWQSKDDFWESVLSFNHVDAKHQIQVTRLDSKHPTH